MVEASVKFSFTQGFEPGMPAQVSGIITTTPLKVTRKGMKLLTIFA